jgi:hypothetical protein
LVLQSDGFLYLYGIENRELLWTSKNNWPADTIVKDDRGQCDWLLWHDVKGQHVRTLQIQQKNPYADSYVVDLSQMNIIKGTGLELLQISKEEFQCTNPFAPIKPVDNNDPDNA